MSITTAPRALMDAGTFSLRMARVPSRMPTKSLAHSDEDFRGAQPRRVAGHGGAQGDGDRNMGVEARTSTP